MGEIIEQQQKFNNMISPVLEQQAQIQAIVSKNNTAISAVTNSPATQAIGLFAKELSNWGRFAVESVELTSNQNSYNLA